MKGRHNAGSQLIKIGNVLVGHLAVEKAKAVVEEEEGEEEDAVVGREFYPSHFNMATTIIYQRESFQIVLHGLRAKQAMAPSEWHEHVLLKRINQSISGY